MLTLNLQSQLELKTDLLTGWMSNRYEEILEY